MNKFMTPPDFIVRNVEDTMKRTRYCIEQVGNMIPMLTYFCRCESDSHELNVPLAYTHFVNLGQEMEQTRKAAIIAPSLGPEFSLLAMQMAERAQNEKNKKEDERDFIDIVHHTLYHIAPRALFVSLPCRLVKADLSTIAQVLAVGPDHPSAEDTIMIVGRNPVRSYALITPIKRDAHGNVYYDQPMRLDSLRGDASHGLGPFSNIYDPVRN